MPTPPGLKVCDTCGLPYQLNRKAAHDLKASHRSAVATGSSSRPVTRRVTRTVTTDQPPAETFGQRMARLRKEKRVQADQARPPGNPDPTPES